MRLKIQIAAAPLLFTQLAILLACFSLLAPAQTSPPPDAFEVSSIKPSSPDARMTIAPQLIDVTFRAVNVSLREILAAAFSFTAERIIGPDWLTAARYDFEAKAADGTPQTAIPNMIRQMLVERFHLMSHLEKRELPVYDLVIAKGGVRMSLYPDPERPLKGIIPGGSPMMRGSLTIAELARMLTIPTGRTVIDKTNLAGRYNLFLSFSSPFQTRSSPDSPPDILTAVREQLGLNLVATKAALDVAIIDRIDRVPSAN